MKKNCWPERISTKDDYKMFQLAYQLGTKDMKHLSSGSCSDECVDCDQFSDSNEQIYSNSSCDICARNIAGMRSPAHGYVVIKNHKNQNKSIHVHMEICDDCLYYMKYGKLDDTTMMEIE